MDTLKIDPQPSSRILKLGKEDSPITRAIVGMGVRSCRTIVAEGWKPTINWVYLRLQGCDVYQGYLFSKPVPAQQLQYSVRDRFSMRDPDQGSIANSVSELSEDCPLHPRRPGRWPHVGMAEGAFSARKGLPRSCVTGTRAPVPETIVVGRDRTLLRHWQAMGFATYKEQSVRRKPPASATGVDPVGVGNRILTCSTAGTRVSKPLLPIANTDTLPPPLAT
ncbi:MAG: hypothetical protein IPP12_17905 [Nitrospira sp.]|nr:hypothetical protein [Nitrospira sp.]